MQLRSINMISRLLIRVAISLTCGVALCSEIISAQRCIPQQRQLPQSHPVVTSQTYNQVLDAVFPRETRGDRQIVFEIILRFRPSFQSTSQIIIRKFTTGVEVIEYTSMVGSIYQKLNKILADGGKEDVIEMTKAIKVKKRTVNVSEAQVMRWYDAFFDSFNATAKTLHKIGDELSRTNGSETILLDGTNYDVWYKHRLNELAFSLYDHEVSESISNYEFRLIRWMNTIRLDVENFK